jgi:phosphoglycerate kinase
MEKELGTAGETVTGDLNGGLSNYKETVYNILGDFLSWLSTHQGLALIIILIVLGIMAWFILNARKNRKQIKNIEYSKNKEIEKKDTLFEEQKNELIALQKKMSDQQGVVSEALLKTIMTLTGYNTDQLQIFFKFLTQISGNPLQIADTQANAMPKSQWLVKEGDDSTEGNDVKEKITPGDSLEETSEDSTEVKEFTMNKLTVEDLNLQGKRVLMRVDFNVPLENGKVANDKRIKAALPTIKYIVKNGGKLILMSHLGRPKGSRVPEMSLKPCVTVLSELLGKDVAFVDDCIGTTVESAVGKLQEGDVLLLENLRYYTEETDNDPAFAEKLAKLGDLYVNDAFGTAHRAHASTEGVTHYFDQCAAGYLMMKELDYLGRVMENPERPFIAILGGAKIAGKIDVITNLLPKVDQVIIGGGMTYTFFKAQGLEIGNSLLEDDKVDYAKEILAQGGDKLVLPVDCLVSDFFDFKARKIGELKEVANDGILPGWMGLDIGSQTIKSFSTILESAKTIIWNGPMGVFEIDETARGTYAIANILADVTAKGATTVIGGGDSASAVNKAGVADKVSHVSTGGGASLEFIEGKTLPGVAALTDNR